MKILLAILVIAFVAIQVLNPQPGLWLSMAVGGAIGLLLRDKVYFQFPTEHRPKIPLGAPEVSPLWDHELDG